MLQRFLPYFKLLRDVWVRFIVALLAGAVYGATSGFGLPFITGKVFPVIVSNA